MGLVTETKASELTEMDHVFHHGTFMAISELKKERGRVKLRMDSLVSSKGWDKDLTEGESVYILKNIKLINS